MNRLSPKTASFLLFMALIVIPLQSEEKKSDAISVKNVGTLWQNIAPFLLNKDGKSVSLDHLTSKDHLLIYQAASWCGRCKRRFTPRLRKYYENHGGGDKFEVIYLSMDTSEEKMKSFGNETKMPWPYVKFEKTSHPIFEKFKTRSVPWMILIDKKGDVLTGWKAFPTYKKLQTFYGEEKKDPAPQSEDVPKAKKTIPQN